MKFKSLLSCLLLAVACTFSSCEKTGKKKDASITFVNVYDKVYLKVGESFTLQYQVEPLDLLYTESINWKSSNDAVALVTMGSIIGMGEGKATITAEIAGAKQTVEVVVAGYKVSGLTLPENFMLNVGDRVRLSASISPEGASLNSVKWTIQDASIAEVQMSDGEVYIKGLKKGETTLTGKVEDIEQTCRIIVDEYIPLESIELSVSNTKINKGESADYTIKFTPSNATIVNDNLEITSSSSSVASISKTSTTSGRINALELGNTTISATYGGIKSNEIEVKVIVGVSSYTIDNIDEYNHLSPDGSFGYKRTHQIVPMINPVQAESNFTYKSSDNSIVKVSESGLIEAVGHGIAVITVTEQNAGSKHLTVRSVKKSELGYKMYYSNDYWSETGKKAVSDNQTISFTKHTYIGLEENPVNYTDENGKQKSDYPYVNNGNIVPSIKILKLTATKGTYETTALSSGAAIAVKRTDGGLKMDQVLLAVSDPTGSVSIGTINAYVGFKEMQLRLYYGNTSCDTQVLAWGFSESNTNNVVKVTSSKKYSSLYLDGVLNDGTIIDKRDYTWSFWSQNKDYIRLHSNGYYILDYDDFKANCKSSSYLIGLGASYKSDFDASSEDPNAIYFWINFVK